MLSSFGATDGIKDVVIVGDGIAAKFAAANIMQRMQKQINLQIDFELQSFEMLMVGKGGGRAYTKGRGYVGGEKVNLMRNEMSHRPGNIVPLDENFMTNNTFELEYRYRDNKRPFDLRKPFQRESSSKNFSLAKERDTSLSLQKFIQTYFPEKSDDIETERWILGAYSNYVVTEELAKTVNLKFEKVESMVEKIDYDSSTKIFSLQAQSSVGRESQKISARHVVLATGLEGDTVPAYMRGLRGKPGIYVGEEVFGKFMAELESFFPGEVDDKAFMAQLDAMVNGVPLTDPQSMLPNQKSWINKKILIVGSGLTMDDIASKLIGNGLHNFELVSRNGHTHELPMDVPAMPELEDASFEIADLLDSRSIPLYLKLPTDVISKKIKTAFLEAKSVAQNYELEKDEPIKIRGQVFSRNHISRALLSQFVVFSYEKMRGELRSPFGDRAYSNSLAAQLFKDIDQDPNLSSWITSSRTSTTLRNIKLHHALRVTKKHRIANVEKVELVGSRSRVSFMRPTEKMLRNPGELEREDKNTIEKIEVRGQHLHVIYKKPDSVVVDYLLICTGRPLGVRKPGFDVESNSTLTNYLFENGLFTLHPVGVGVAMDEEGRAEPDRQKIPGTEPIPLYVASPFSAKGDLYMPANIKRHPFSMTVAEAIPGLRPLIRQLAKSLVYNLANWSPDEGAVEYVYGKNGAVRVSENDEYDAEASDDNRSSDGDELSPSHS